MPTTRSPIRTGFGRVAVVAALPAFALASCGSDDDAGTASGAVESVDDDVVSDAEQVLDDAGIDVDAEGTGEVMFLGETYVFAAAESFGCFILEDGGSDGAVSFTGTADDGSEIEVDWAGDSVDFAYVDITLADGTEYQTGFADAPVEVSVEGSTAQVSAEVGEVGVIDGASEPLVGTFACS